MNYSFVANDRFRFNGGFRKCTKQKWKRKVFVNVRRTTVSRSLARKKGLDNSVLEMLMDSSVYLKFIRPKNIIENSCETNSKICFHLKRHLQMLKIDKSRRA